MFTIFPWDIIHAQKAFVKTQIENFSDFFTISRTIGVRTGKKAMSEPPRLRLMRARF